ncbi:FPR2 (YDR519W) [Zygosaccharomyces parabailii]|nr:FPR2 (YDR519W) [Zygosaccharomyces parabailii]CDH13289.1 related to Peptidyl-prolyl cis-trans isomerase FPR2 [Zygosaccharomyces bailii ISA1307]
MQLLTLLNCFFFSVVTAGSLENLQIGITKQAPHCNERAFPGDIVDVHYTGYFRDNNKQFDSSYSRGKPISFTLGSGQVIYGWDQGLIGTCVGEERKIQIPSKFAYGENGIPGVIPPNADMVFDVKLVSVSR